MAKKQNGGTRLRGNNHPVVLEINTRLFVRELSKNPAKPLTLDAIPENVIEDWASIGLDAVWLMGVWTTGPLGLTIARTHREMCEEYLNVLPDCTDGDVIGSPYAIQNYRVSPELGGDASLAKLRSRLAEKGIGLILDFVCNHTARDHEWIVSHPEYYVQGTEDDLAREGGNYFRSEETPGAPVIAYGRDPMYAGWTDTAQLNHAHAGMRKALIATLEKIAGRCDGVRCDMAMLALNNVFAGTWGMQAYKGMRESGVQAQGEFWKEAIDAVRQAHPGFLFIAESYWDLEWDLQQLDFDYTYDKRLYDRLLREGASAVRDHLHAEIDYQNKSVRFIENHDEARAARALSNDSWHYAAATVVATVPGMLLLHEGEFEARRIKIPVQLGRRPVEPPSLGARAFYRRLVFTIGNDVFRKGEWKLLKPRAAWHDNYTYQNFLVFWWNENFAGRRLVVINYAPLAGQCYVDLPLVIVEGSALEFRDLMSEAVFVRDRHGLLAKGMYFDLTGYGLHIFDVASARK